MKIQKVNILGIGVSAINIITALKVMDEWIQTREKRYVTVTGIHGIIESQRKCELRTIHDRAGLVTPDGMPLVWLSHFHGFLHVRQVCGSELMLSFCEYSLTKGYKHFFYGGAEGVPDLLNKRLTARYPGLEVVGTYSPPFRPLTPEEDQQIVDLINATKPDIVWVGLSTPKQEQWMSDHLGKIEATVMIGVGAAFDFHAGLKKRAPRWMQRSGLEWFFRLLAEPCRLWKRYLVNNFLFIILLLGQELGIKRYSLADL